VVAFFVAAAVIAVMLIVMMHEAGFSADRTGRIVPPTICPLRPRAFGCKLMMTVPALIFLIPIRIFAVTIKRMVVVALWT
jgi:hypothetical protein